VIPNWEFRRNYIPWKCVVKETEIGEKIVREKVFYRPEILIDYKYNEEDFTVRAYELATLRHDGGYDYDRTTAEEIARSFQVGKEYSCWINRDTPNRAVLYRAPTIWSWFFLVIPVFLIISGGTGLYIAFRRRSVSAERMVRIRSTLFPGFAPPKKGVPYPTVPDPADINNSPGTHLAYRLPMTQVSTIKIIITLILCLFWNIVSWTVFLLSLFATNWVVQVGVPAMIFGATFCLLGLILLVWVVHQFLVAFGVGPTILEMSDHPIYPGRKYRLMLLQFGAFRVKSYQVDLVCEEIVRFRQGTDTITTRKEVFCKPIFVKHDFETQSDTPLQEELIVRLPLGTMHSFRTEHNEILWKFHVHAEFAGWPKLQRTCPIVVRPPTISGYHPDWEFE